MILIKTDKIESILPDVAHLSNSDGIQKNIYEDFFLFIPM